MNSNCETLRCVCVERKRPLWDSVREWFREIRARREDFEQRRELAHLGDHLLRDIGLDPHSLRMDPSSRDGQGPSRKRLHRDRPECRIIH